MLADYIKYQLEGPVMFDLFFFFFLFLFFPEVHSRNSWKRAFLNVRFIRMIRECWGRGILILKDDQIVEWGILFFQAKTFNIPSQRYWNIVHLVDIFSSFNSSTITQKSLSIITQRDDIDLDKSSYSFPLPNISLFGIKMNGTKYRTPRSTTTTTCRVSIYKYKKAAEIDGREKKSIGVSKILRWQPFTIPIVFWQGLIRPRRDLTLLYSNISPD